MTVTTRKVGEISTQIRGVTYSKQDAAEVALPGYLPVLRAGNIEEHGLTFGDLVYVPASNVSDKQRLRKHDILIAASSGSIDVVGKAARALNDFDGGFGAFCKVLRPNGKVDPGYFAHYFKTPEYRRRISFLAAGANINNLRNEDLDNLEIPLPPLAEQKRIAGILDAADALRAKRREALAQLDSLLQSTFLDLFGDPVNGSKYPVENLGTFVTFITTGGRGWADYYRDRGSRFIRSLDVQMNSISNEEVIFVDPPKNAEAQRTRVQKRDVLLTMTGSRIGRASSVPDELDGAYISQHVAILRFAEALEPEYVARFLANERCGQLEIKKWQYGQTKPGLNFEQVRSFQIPIPPVKQQRHFTGVVASVERQMKAHRSHLSQLDTLFASLQSRAFRGDL